MKTKMIAILLVFTANVVFAQADLEKTTGKYFAADGLEYVNAMKAKKKQKEDIDIKFIGEENGSIANKLVITWKGGDLKAMLDEKIYNKKKAVIFRAGNNTIFQLEEGILAIGMPDGSVIGDVLVKDKNKLKDFDLETAKAIVQQMVGDLNSEANDAALEKMMTSTAFKNNVDKVIFVDNKNIIFNPYGRVEYDEKKHIKTQTIGQPIWFNYYSKVNALAKYGKSSEMNIEYEMEGVKKDRKSCAKQGRTWAENIPKIESSDRFLFLQGRSICYPNEKRFDYAFLALMAQLNGNLIVGKTYNLKVTVHVYKDGANIAKLAEGTIAMKYEAESEKSMNLWKEWIDSM